MELKKVPNFGSKKYYCELCDYNTSRESQYNRHLSTRKHKMELNGIKKSSKEFLCKYCEKKYQTQSGLWKHENKCKDKTNIDANIKKEKNNKKTIKKKSLSKKSLIDMVMQNNEILMETQKQINNILPNAGQTINNTYNNNININIFLNENCKNALNIMDFINLLQNKLNTLDYNNIDYQNNVSSFFLQELKDMDIEKRPLHCCDIKQEIIYVKDNDVWEKDDENIKIRNAINYLNKENIKKLPIMLEDNNSNTDNNEICIDLVSNITNIQENDLDNIISKIAHETVIK